jgi:hypothetical protein
VALNIAPDTGAGVARIQYDPPMFGMENSKQLRWLLLLLIAATGAAKCSWT